MAKEGVRKPKTPDFVVVILKLLTMIKKMIWAMGLLAMASFSTAKETGPEKQEELWRVEDSSGKAELSMVDGVMDVVSPDGLTLWYTERLTGEYEISYRISMVNGKGKFDRLSDMNCFWAANDPEHPEDLFARSEWRNGIFQRYNSLDLFYVGYGGNENTTTRFRTYHGEFYGKDENRLKPVIKEYRDEPHLLKPDHWYEVVITVADGVTTFACDGEQLFSLPLKGREADGHFAIRLWKNHIKMRDFRVRRKEAQFAFSNYRRYYREAREASDEMKRQAVKQLRSKFHQQPYRAGTWKERDAADRFWNLLGDDGTFADLNATEERFEREDVYQKGFANTPDDEVGIFIADALGRVHCIGEAYRTHEMDAEKALDNKVMKAIVHYGGMEISRPNDKPRFHSSCFAIPTVASNIYFSYLKEMDEVEESNAPSLLKDACDMLKVLGLQAYTQPLRNDETDRNVVSLDRFRNHVWWVGGNALAYRPLLPIAAMYSSSPMIELLAEVCRKGISTTSQTTCDEAFWIEGFTADGAGWGHGRQCLIWGYPIDGTIAALNMLTMLKDTPWAQRLSAENVEALMNFFRGGNWYYYKGFRLPGLDRRSYVFNPDEKPIPYLKLLEKVLDYWASSFSASELEELRQLKTEAAAHRIEMAGYAPGVYNGVRWFFNNDDLIKKTPDYHVSINMASLRCDGLESADFADRYNFYPTDGMTLFQRQGNEYFRIMGGWDVTASPGVTAREGMEKLIPVTNWRGYCSKHDLAAGATDGSRNAVAGYVFEKMHGSYKKGVNDMGDVKAKNRLLYGFKATKGYFFLGDYFVALGAGITNDSIQLEGNLRTTIDQTVKQAPVCLVRKGKKREIPMGEAVETDGRGPTWVMQEGGFAYTVLPDWSGNLHVACEMRPADWVRMNPSNARLEGMQAEVPVLRLWIDHGREVADGTYGYAVYLGKGEPKGKLPFEVLRNDTLVQAVRSTDGQIVGAMFYSEKTELKARSLLLRVSSPCALLVQHESGRCCVSVSDALMNPSLREIKVTLNGEEKVVPLPQGKECGKSVTVYW